MRPLGSTATLDGQPVRIVGRSIRDANVQYADGTIEPNVRWGRLSDPVKVRMVK